MFLALQNQACISSAAIVPETAANTNQINTCQSTASLHNGFVIGDFALGGASTGLASAAAFATDTNTKNALAYVGIGTGAALIVGTAIAGYTRRTSRIPTAPASSARCLRSRSRRRKRRPSL